MSQFYSPFQRHFRKRRMQQFAEMFALTSETRIIDIGGYELNWTLIDVAPSVLLVNVEDEHYQNGRFEKTQGDGRALAYGDRSFDIAYSNSVIEHVGDAEDQARFAHEIRRVAARYYVQTPNRDFFVEPHLIAAYIHWLPPTMTRRLVRRFSVWGWVHKPTLDEVDRYLASIRLLDRTEFEALFPDAEIVEERFMGMTKSLIAIRR